MTTMIERVAKALRECRINLPGAGGLHGELHLARFLSIELAGIAIAAMRGPIDEWLDHQIQHGHAPDGFPISMTPEYAMGRRSAFQATQAMIKAALAEGEGV